jgi:predicted O-linked N-acetylglucosamine transferase (SPINDLY family)
MSSPRALAEARFREGDALRDQGRLEDAAARYREAIELAPDFPAPRVALGNLMNDQGRPDEAIAYYRQALAIRPDYADALANLGNAHQYRGEIDEAIACYRKAIELDPDYAEAHHNLASALEDAGRVEEAHASYRRALSVRPEFIESRWALVMSQIPDVYAGEDEPAQRRAAFARELGELEQWTAAHSEPGHARAVGSRQPFYLSYQEEDNRELLARYGAVCARLMARWAEKERLPAPAARAHAGPVRVGVVSGCFWNHSVWNAIVRGWFEQLDRRRFSLHAFDIGFREDEETAFARAHAESFEKGARGPRQWADAILAQRPDVLVYPDIGLDPMAVKLASLRLAPVQAATWGHPETTGLPTIDHFLSAEAMEPGDGAGRYTERLLRLPHLGCFYRSLRPQPQAPDLAALGIAADAPLLLCPGTPFKYAPRHDGVFPDIARRLGRCTFVFFARASAAVTQKLWARLERAFARAGLSAGDFVRFVPWQPRPAFYGLLGRADVYLDTIGFSGFNGAMQAIECGLPVVAAEGRFLRGRLASGILRRMRLDELVARSDAEYAERAAALALDAAYRERIRARIAAARGILFEDSAPIRALEDFLESAARQAGTAIPL